MAKPGTMKMSTKRFAAVAVAGDCFVDNFPMSGPYVDALSKQYETIRTKAYKERRLARYGKSTYVFIESQGCWCMTTSPQGMRYITDRLDFESVTVNYSTAVRPYLDFADMLSKPANSVDGSVCIGTWRLFVELVQPDTKESKPGPPKDHGTLTFVPMAGVSKMRSKKPGYAKMSTLCICPVRTQVIPRAVSDWTPLVPEEVLSNILAPEDLRVLMWSIGNGLLDPVYKPRCIIMYGPGGDGKTTTINTLMECLRGAVHPLASDYSTGTKQMSDADTLGCMHSRFVVYGDIELNGDNMNSGFWKRITSGDVATVGETRARINCTGFFGSNYLWYPNSQTKKPWFLRRMIVLTMKSLTPGAKPPPGEYTDSDVTRFISSSLRLRLHYGTSPPLTVRMVLVTIFGYKVHVATRGIQDREDANFAECNSATWSISYTS